MPGWRPPAPRASSQGPPHPTLRANPFPEVTDLFCRLPLSTLFHQLEAVHLGDLLRLWVRPGVRTILLPWIFTGRRGRTGPRQDAGLCRPWDPSSGQTVFRVMDRQGEKRTLPGAPADVSTFSYVAVAESTSRRRNVDRLPLRARRRRGRSSRRVSPVP